MASTIHDVARLAGVHASTVSRVLNGKSAITDRTRERVYAAMKQLDYHPNSMARSLASGLAGMIGLVLDTADESSFHNADFSSSQFAIERVAQAHGYHLVIANGAHLAAGAVQALVLERKVDGLILPPSGANLSLLSRLDRFPCVMLGQPAGQYPDASWVDIDNELGAVMAVRHLLSRGYASVGFLGSQTQETMDFVGRRVRGYYRALPPGARLGLPDRRHARGRLPRGDGMPAGGKASPRLCLQRQLLRVRPAPGRCCAGASHPRGFGRRHLQRLSAGGVHRSPADRRAY